MHGLHSILAFLLSSGRSVWRFGWMQCWSDQCWYSDSVLLRCFFAEWHVCACGRKTATAFCTFFLTRICCTLCDHVCLVLLGVGGRMFPFVCTCDACACYVMSRVGLGGGMLTFVCTCDTHACYVMSCVGWGGSYNVFVRLQRTCMLRHDVTWVGWGLTVVCACDTRACYLCHVLCWVGGKMFWWKQVACCTSARKSDRRKKMSSEHQNLCKLQANVLKPLDCAGQKSMIVKMQIH